MPGPPTRAQWLKCRRLAFPRFSCPEFYKNAKTVGWYLRTEGEGYCRLATDLEISVPWHKSTRCHFQLYKRICLWMRHGPNSDVRGHFHLLLFFHNCPWICLSCAVLQTHLASSLMSIPVEKSIWHVTDSELEIEQNIEFCRDSFGTNRKCHFLFTILYISFTSYF